MLSIVSSGALQGIDAVPVEVECNTGLQGEAKPVLVGLASAAVKESWDRVYSALSNSGFGVPNSSKTTINLAPGHLRKEGPLYDLPIALGLLAAQGILKAPELARYLIAGELSLSGETRPVRGGLALASLAQALGKEALLVPPVTAEEARLVEGLPVYPVRSLAQAAAFLEGREALKPLPPGRPEAFSSGRAADFFEVDFAEVKGQHALRRAVEVAVAGAHNLLMIGPPGSGKSMIAKRIPTVMPELRFDEYLEVLRIYSATGLTIEETGMRRTRPFRSPHHTISDVGLIGGGTIPGPGEISLAHHGVLFLDELPEFKRSALEVLRQPLEDGMVTISRSAGRITLPARFMLVAAMNPTPDGLAASESTSTPAQIQRYRSRLSGPLLDRIDLHVEAPALTVDELRHAASGESSAAMRERVQEARDRQAHRFRGTPIRTNAAMTARQIRDHCALSNALGDLLQQAMTQLQLSARAYDRILKVARTAADLASAEDIGASHLLEAIQYRNLDRGLLG